MKLFRKMKDGGPKSRVWGYWLIEWKRVFSIVLLRFEDGTREAYHSHAFNSVSWVLRGKLVERLLTVPSWSNVYLPSWRPVWTYRNTFHKVRSSGRTWVLSLRGPWSKTWSEWSDGVMVKLTNGREVVK